VVSVIRVYLKTEPAGEVGFGKLCPEDVLELEKSYESPDFKDSDFVSGYYNYFRQSAHGVFTSLDDRIEGEVPNYELVETICLPTGEDKVTIEDGWYLLATSLSKCSIEFDFEPAGGVFDAEKFVVEYKKFEFGDFEDELYGALSFNVVCDFKYDGNSLLEDGDHELVDRGFDREARIFQVFEGTVHPFYSNRNYSEESWGRKPS